MIIFFMKQVEEMLEINLYIYTYSSKSIGILSTFLGSPVIFSMISGVRDNISHRGSGILKSAGAHFFYKSEKK